MAVPARVSEPTGHRMAITPSARSDTMRRWWAASIASAPSWNRSSPHHSSTRLYGIAVAASSRTCSSVTVRHDATSCTPPSGLGRRSAKSRTPTHVGRTAMRAWTVPGWSMPASMPRSGVAQVAVGSRDVLRREPVDLVDLGSAPDGDALGWRSLGVDGQRHGRVRPQRGDAGCGMADAGGGTGEVGGHHDLVAGPLEPGGHHPGSAVGRHVREAGRDGGAEQPLGQVGVQEPQVTLGMIGSRPMPLLP